MALRAIAFASILVGQFLSCGGFAVGNPAKGVAEVLQLACGPFTSAESPKPTPQSDPHAVERIHTIKQTIKSGSYTVIFFGDSLIEKWDATVWQQYFGRRGAVNAGVNGDRTEHLLWRLQNGSLDGPSPKAVVVLIGTNDVGRDRPAQIIAEGIRANLEAIRARLPETRILLLGLLPRMMFPRLIPTAADH